MAKEKTLQLQLLGAAILIARFFALGFQVLGYCMAGIRHPDLEPAPAPARAPSAPSLTPGERLAWTALEWRLARQKLRAGPTRTRPG
jgi:hypothetical protein